MPTQITREDVQRLTAEGAVVIDTVPESEYAEEHRGGAINIAQAEVVARPATIVATWGTRMRNAPRSPRI